MKAAVFEQFKGAIQINEVPDPKPEPHGVVVKVLATGMCLSDWHGWQGHDEDIELPHVPGHELAGEVIELGKDVRNFKIGDRVTVPFVGGCGSCEQSTPEIIKSAIINLSQDSPIGVHLQNTPS